MSVRDYSCWSNTDVTYPSICWQLGISDSATTIPPSAFRSHLSTRLRNAAGVAMGVWSVHLGSASGKSKRGGHSDFGWGHLKLGRGGHFDLGWNRPKLQRRHRGPTTPLRSFDDVDPRSFHLTRTVPGSYGSAAHHPEATARSASRATVAPGSPALRPPRSWREEVLRGPHCCSSASPIWWTIPSARTCTRRTSTKEQRQSQHRVDLLSHHLGRVTGGYSSPGD